LYITVFFKGKFSSINQNISWKDTKAQQVCIIGSWDNWDEKKSRPLNQENDKWSILLTLSPGEYQFKFIVDEKWVISKFFPTIITVDGYINNIITVYRDQKANDLIHSAQSLHFQNREDEDKLKKLLMIQEDFEAEFKFPDPMTFGVSLWSFPTLEIIPKDCPDPKNCKFIVLESTLRLFETLWSNWKDPSKKTSISIRCGRYLNGPCGIGKSVTLYQLCCMFRAIGSLVVYLPNCDSWASSYNEDNEIDYLERFLNALTQYWNGTLFKNKIVIQN